LPPWEASKPGRGRAGRAREPDVGAKGGRGRGRKKGTVSALSVRALQEGKTGGKTDLGGTLLPTKDSSPEAPGRLLNPEEERTWLGHYDSE